MKKIIFYFLSAISFVVCAQDLEFETKKYNWLDTTVKYTPLKTDTAYSSIILMQRSVIEYAFSGDTLKRYSVTHTIKYLCDDKAVEDNNKIYLSLYDAYNMIELKARVWKDGKVVSVSDKKSIKSVTEEGKEYKLLAIEGVAKGTIMETITKVKLGSDMYDYSMIQTASPILYKEFTLIAPTHLYFSTKVYNTKDFTQLDTTYAKRRVVHFAFKKLPSYLVDDKYSFESANRIRIEYNFTENRSTQKKQARYPEIGSRWFDFINANYEKNEKTIDKMLAKMDLSICKNNEEKVFAVESYIKSNVVYKEDADGVYDLKDALKLKYGNSTTISQLLFYSFRKLGINFEIVITCEKSNRTFDPKFDSWTYAKKQIFYFPEFKKYLDPVITFYRLGVIDEDFLGQWAIFVKTVSLGDNFSGVGSVKQIGINTVETGTDIDEQHIKFTPDMSEVDISLVRQMGQYCDQTARIVYFYGDEKKRDDFIKEIVKGSAEAADVKTVKVSNFNLNSFNEYNAPVKIEAAIKTKHYCEKAGKNISFKVGELIGPQVEMYQEKPRTYPVDLTYQHSYKRSIAIDIPQGYAAKGLDKLNMNLTIKGDDGKPKIGFISSYEVKEGKVIVSCDEFYNAIHYPIEEFNDYKKIINASADFNKVVILFEKEVK